MDQRVRWVTTFYRGLYIYALAYQLQRRLPTSCPGPKWSYFVGVGRTDVPSINTDFDDDRNDECDYFTREAAEQAALQFGRRIVNVMLEFE
ncbi:hypothetical protein [Cupriavidus agavae]|uniref:Uncharacterized protein n=1 Tax=Cupriavidus agavae TaxID=1001822 RepID=A0A4Q7RPA9_9BURK|nr:hypothetical protein [Cupriavidus agavae]RZT35496.1 hypothetical protein EV147_3946 [Cupriavidus agavae]